jgi:hypothetical protein
MRDVYGEGVTAKEVLTENKVTAPASVRAFPATLGCCSSRTAEMQACGMKRFQVFRAVGVADITREKANERIPIGY